MLVHLRLVVPKPLRTPVLDLLCEDPRITNVTDVAGASLDPPGDLVGADVARESADEVLSALRRLGLHRDGSISVTIPQATPFEAADRIDELAEGEPDDSVMWDVVMAQAADAAEPSRSFHLFLILATALAAIAVLTDSPILVVGAMVVGPDFGPVGAVCAGVVRRRWALAGRAGWLLLRGYAVAILVVAALALLGRAAGAVTPEAVSGDRPLTGFIWRPDLWSVLVAVIAGMVGALALTAEKSNTLVGVFIAVTTVPAAGNLALALAVWDIGELHGSAAQLGVNVLGMLVGGIGTLGAQWLLGPGSGLGSGPTSGSDPISARRGR